ncbi:transcription termination/antitermination protein NusG [Patescibacteria group bacterium]
MAAKKKTPKPSQKVTKKAKKVALKKKAQPSAPGHLVITKTTDKRAFWYVVHTYSGYEAKVSKQLHQRITSMGLANKVFEVLIPSQEKIVIKQQEKKKIREKVFPGYIMVKMILTDESWLAVRTTPGITGFIGTGNKPTPLPPQEVQAILRFIKTEAPKFKAKFTQGEAVKITDGPFTDFLGTVDSIDDDKGKVKVLVSIFGRETPVELDFLQVAKL